MAPSTKHLLAKSLKALMGEKTLDKITVKEIVARCGVNRQTFYYHFRDIWDLLDWFFLEESNEFSRRYPDYPNQTDTGDAIRKMCSYLMENRQMAINIYNSMGRESFGSYLTRDGQAALPGVHRAGGARRVPEAMSAPWSTSTSTVWWACCSIGSTKAWWGISKRLSNSIDRSSKKRSMRHFYRCQKFRTAIDFSLDESTPIDYTVQNSCPC